MIRTLFLAFVVSLGLISTSGAQISLPGGISQLYPSGANPTYTGPGDIVPGAEAWWGLRCYSRADASAPQAVNVRRSSDNATQDIGLSSGCDLAAIGGFCSSNCFVVEYYDQTGNGNNVIQTTMADQGCIGQGTNYSCGGSLGTCGQFTIKPVCGGGGGTGTGYVGTVTAEPEPISSEGVFFADPSFAQNGALISSYPNLSTGFSVNLDNTPNFYFGSSPSLTVVYVEAQWYSFAGVANSTTSSVNLQSSIVSGTAGGTIGTKIAYLNFTDGSANGVFFGSEAGYWLLAFSTAQRDDECNNSASYYGTHGPC